MTPAQKVVIAALKEGGYIKLDETGVALFAEDGEYICEVNPRTFNSLWQSDRIVITETWRGTGLQGICYTYGLPKENGNEQR